MAILCPIKGSGEVKGAEVSSHNDHRIAMATAVAALSAKGNTLIHDAQAVNKSYPDFYKDLKSIKTNSAANNKKGII